MDYNYGYNYGYNSMYGLQTGAIFSMVGLVLGLICAFVVYFVFLKRSNEGRFKGFAGWMYNFLNFNKLTIEAIIKICYIFLAIWITVSAFGLIGTSFGAFLMLLIFGNLFVRIGHELIMISIKICRNTIEINKKMNLFVNKASGNEDLAAEKAEEVKEEPVEEAAPEAAEEVAEEEATEKVCPNCGAVITDEMAFCGKCGAKL